MDISHNIFDGRDYLPSYYHALLQNKRAFPCVAEVDGKIVSDAPLH